MQPSRRSFRNTPGGSQTFPFRSIVWFALGIVIMLAGCQSPSTNGVNSGSGNSMAGGPAGTKEVSFKTADGWNIFADLYLPAGTSKGAVIMLHQRNGAASDWNSLADALQKTGYTALAIDQRGAGRSVQGPPGAPAAKGDDAPWDTTQDIAAAIAYLQDKGPIGLAGASYGANNALIYAAAHPDQVKSVVLFSPGADYHGLNALTPAKTWQGPLEIFHDKGDSVAGNGPEQIDRASPSKDHKLILTSGSRHGTDLLRDALSDKANNPAAFFQRTLK